MRFYFDLDLGKFVSQPGYSGLLQRVEFKRGDAANIVVAFYRGTTPTAISGTPSEMVFVVKKDVSADALALLLANTWTSNDAGTVWTAPLTAGSGTLTTEIGAAKYKDWLAEFTFTDEDGGPNTTQTLTARIHNDLWKGTEGTPLNEPDPDEWLEERRPAPLELTAPPVNDSPRSVQSDGVSLIEQLTSTVMPVLDENGTKNGKPIFTSDGASSLDAAELFGWFIYWELPEGETVGTWYVLHKALVLDQSEVGYYSTIVSNADLPPLTGWLDPDGIGSPGIGVPVLQINAAITGTVATALGQLAIVSTTNASGSFEDVWTASNLSPMTWQPPGQITRSPNGTLYRAIVDDDGIPSTELAYP